MQKNYYSFYKKLYISIFIIILLFIIIDLVLITTSSESPLVYKLKILEPILLFLLLYLYLKSLKHVLENKNIQSKIYNKIIPGAYAQIEGDENLTILYANSEFYKITNYTKTEVFSRFNNSSKQFIHPEDVTDVIRNFKFQSDNNEKLSSVFRVLTKDKKVIWILATGIMDSSRKKHGHPIYHFTFINISRFKSEKATSNFVNI